MELQEVGATLVPGAYSWCARRSDGVCGHLRSSPGAFHALPGRRRTAPLPQKRVAVVGSGISGLSAAWLLHRCAPIGECGCLPPGAAPLPPPPPPPQAPPRSCACPTPLRPPQVGRPGDAVRERGVMRRAHPDGHQQRLPSRPGLPGGCCAARQQGPHAGGRSAPAHRPCRSPRTPSCEPNPPCSCPARSTT